MSISRHTVYNLIGSLIPLITALATIPVYIRLIGESRYGVLAIVWLLLGYFGVFDLGLGRATAQKIARLQSASREAQARVFWTALVLNGACGTIGGLLIWPAADYFATEYFKIDQALQAELNAAVPWLIIALPVATISGVLTGALQGIQKFLLLNTISTFGSLLFQLLPLAAASIWSADLRVILPAAVLSRIPTLLTLLWYCHKHITSGSAISFRQEEASELLSFGGWITISAFISPIMVMIDRFITGSVLGAKDVAYYTVPYQLAERTTILPAALASSLFPKFASLEPVEQRIVAESALRTLIVIMTPLTVLAIVVIKPFLSLWLSADFSQASSSVAMILFAGFWINGLARIPHAQLQAMGCPNIVAKIHMAEIVPYFLLLYLAIDRYGLVGAAWTFSLRLYVDFILLAYYAGFLRNVILVKAGAMVFIGLAISLGRTVAFGELRWSLLLATLLISLSAWCLANVTDNLRGRFKSLFNFSE